ALPCQSLQARVNRLVGAHRCAGLQRSSALMQQADGFLIGAMVRGGTRSPTVCTKLGPDAALVPPPRQATTYKRLQPRALASSPATAGEGWGAAPLGSARTVATPPSLLLPSQGQGQEQKQKLAAEAAPTKVSAGRYVPATVPGPYFSFRQFTEPR